MRLAIITSSFWVLSAFRVAGSLAELEASPSHDVTEQLLSTVVRTHYRNPEGFLAVRVQNGNRSTPSLLQQQLIDGLLRTNNDWLSASFEELPESEGRPAYYSVFLVLDYRSLCYLLDRMTYQTYQFDGLYTIFIEQLSERAMLKEIMEKLWNYRIMNAVVIVQDGKDGEYEAHSYHPYREGQCGIAVPYAVDRYVNGLWNDLARWFPSRTDNFNGCPLVVGSIHIRPCSIIDQEGNRTIYKGIEVSQVVGLASKFNFTVQYRISDGTTRWGFARAVNSTGLMGWIQRSEVDFGIGSIGISASRVQHLRQGIPSRFSQVLMAIPPKRPFTSLEKLIKPFSLQTWLCVIFCQAGISLLARWMFGTDRSSMRVEFDRLPNAFYAIWVLMMGGPCARLRMDSTRLFIIIFVLNMLVVRTLYHAGMFERLQASNSLASDLNTLEQINRAGKMYHMHKTISLFFNDNPLVGRSRICHIPSDNANWEELLYRLSEPGSDFVVALPLDCIKYYVKLYGDRGLVYVGKHTGITYNTAFFYPKTTSLQEPFSAQVLAFHSAGLVDHWAQDFEDNRYWSNAKEDPEPASIKWNHISGAFYLCGTMQLFAVVAFFAELGWARWTERKLERANQCTFLGTEYIE